MIRRETVMAFVLLAAGCATAPIEHPIEGVEWRESVDGRIALCFPSDDCYRPSESTWRYFEDRARRVPADGTLRPD